MSKGFQGGPIHGVVRELPHKLEFTNYFVYFEITITVKSDAHSRCKKIVASGVGMIPRIPAH
jgi:hypothetical protein